MNNEFDVIIIGAGPAGLFAASNIHNYKNILLLEKKASPGKKLLMSGSGRCNITQSGPVSDFFTHYADKHRFLVPALKEFTNIDLIRYLKERGINVITDKNGKIFPETQSSYTVLEMLLRDCRIKNVEIKLNQEVEKVELINEQFHVQTQSASFVSRKLIIATGGKSYPTSGSTGDGYNFAKAFGHNVIKPKPALAAVYIKNYKFKEISGVSLSRRNISLFRNNVKIKDHTGDIGFTHWGLSGPGIIDFSRYIEANDTLKINMIDRKMETLKNDLIQESVSSGNTSVKRFIKNYTLPESLAKLILAELNIDEEFNLGNLNKNLRNQLLSLLCEYPFVVERTGDFNTAMVTCGGVSVKEISPKTMESKLIKNLYFIGEVIDVDGDTGGYNLQAAFSTAFIAGKYM